MKFICKWCQVEIKTFRMWHTGGCVGKIKEDQPLHFLEPWEIRALYGSQIDEDGMQASYARHQP